MTEPSHARAPVRPEKCKRASELSYFSLLTPRPASTMFAPTTLARVVHASDRTYRVRSSSRHRVASVVSRASPSSEEDHSEENRSSDNSSTNERPERSMDARSSVSSLVRAMRVANEDTARGRVWIARGRTASVAAACATAVAVGGGWTRGWKPPTPARASASVSLDERISTIQANGTYIAQRVFGWPLYGKVFVIMMAMVPLVLAAASLYKHVSEGDWGESIAKTFYWLNNVPGADSTGEETFKSAIVAQLIVFCGMFTFAILIGVVSDEIASKVDEVKTGNSKVYEQNHTVILNWNDQLIPLLKQIAVAKSEGIGFKKPVVLLANKEKEEMDSVIEDELADSPPLTVVTRQGAGHNPQDLDRVNAWNAERVIVLHDGDEQDPATVESQKAAAVLNLRASVSKDTSGVGPSVIVQVPRRLPEIDDSTTLAIDLTDRPGSNNGPCALVNGTAELSKLKAYSIMQPGGNQLFEDLMLQSDESSEFYTYAHPSLAGKTFQEAWRMFEAGTLVGITPQGGPMILGPKDSDVIGDNGEVIVIADNKAAIEKDIRTIQKLKGRIDTDIIPPPGSQRSVMKRCPIKMPAAKKYVMLGWNEESSSALQDMLVLAPPGSMITVIAEENIEKSEFKGNKYCTVKHVRMDAKKRSTLEQQKVHEADAILIMPKLEQSDSTQDSHVLATLMQVAHLVKTSNHGHAPHIVTELSSEVSKQVAEDVYSEIGTVDIILHDNLIGGALLQVSANLKLAGLFEFLLEKEGRELYMRPHDEFVTSSDVELYWGELCERARERDEVAIGVMRADGTLRVSPRKSDRLTLVPGDRVIVLAEDWWTPKSVKVKQS